MQRKTRLMLLGVGLGAAIAAGGYGIWRLQSPDASTPDTGAASAAEELALVERPMPQLPAVSELGLRFEDGRTINDGAFRTFEIPLAGGGTVYLSAAYLDDPDWKSGAADDEHLIFELVDGDAAFSSAVALEMPRWGKWQQIRLQIGDFAQDYCGDVRALYSFRNGRIFAIAPIGAAEIDFAASQCPLTLDAFVAERARYEPLDAPDDFSAFCEVRQKCLKAYYSQPENHENLVLGWLKRVATIDLR